MRRKLEISEIALAVTSVLFIVSLFFNKWIFLIFTLIWLATVGYCIYKMIKRSSGGIGKFLEQADEMAAQNLKSDSLRSKTRGAIEFSIIPIFVLAVIGVFCSLLSIILM